MKLFAATAALVLCLAGSAQAQGWQEIVHEGFTLRWATTGANELAVELTGPTTGWVAVGFDPDSMMLGANIIIGYVSGGTTYMRDDYGWQPTSHRDDTLLGGTSDVTIDGGSESGGQTEIMFSIPLDSGDPYDKPLYVGSGYTVLLARGPDGADNFTTQHEFITMTGIVIWGLDLGGPEDSGGLIGTRPAADPEQTSSCRLARSSLPRTAWDREPFIRRAAL